MIGFSLYSIRKFERYEFPTNRRYSDFTDFYINGNCGCSTEPMSAATFPAMVARHANICT